MLNKGVDHYYNCGRLAYIFGYTQSDELVAAYIGWTDLHVEGWQWPPYRSDLYDCWNPPDEVS
jgi:hypothetical protein